MSPSQLLPPVVLDTNILIYASQGIFSLRHLAARYSTLLISRVTEVEALGFAFSSAAEEAAMRLLIAQTTALNFTEDEAQHAIAYRKLPKKIKFPDAAILATARAARADLLTQNTADFRGLDPAVRVLSIQDL